MGRDVRNFLKKVSDTFKNFHKKRGKCLLFEPMPGGILTVQSKTARLLF